MNITVDGLNSSERETLLTLIKQTINEIFQDRVPNIDSIIVTDNFRELVNSTHRETHPEEEYIPEGSNTTLAKTFKYEDNNCKIILNTNTYQKDNSGFLENLYHELTHTKYYNDICKYKYSKISQDSKIESVDDIIDIFTFKTIDEFNAYKKMYIKYPNSTNKYTHTLNNINIIFQFLESTPPNFIDEIDYMNKLTSFIGICLPILYLNNSTYLENQANYYGDTDVRWKCLNELYNLILGFDTGIATDDDFQIAKKYVSFMYDWFNY